MRMSGRKRRECPAENVTFLAQKMFVSKQGLTVPIRRKSSFFDEKMSVEGVRPPVASNGLESSQNPSKSPVFDENSPQKILKFDDVCAGQLRCSKVSQSTDVLT